MSGPSRTLIRAGVAVTIPDTWHEISLPENEKFGGLIVARKSGTANLMVEKLPGSVENHLELSRRNLANSDSKDIETKITRLGKLEGSGFRFVRDGGAGETVIFMPRGALEGWYIVGVVSHVEKGAKREFDDVLRSLKRL